MRIIHIDFSGTYNEDMSYQENLIPRENARDGHEVIFVTTCYKWDNGEIIFTNAEDRILSDGVRLIRMPYRHNINRFITNKIRYVDNVFNLLIALKPDVIMIHCLQTFALKEIIKYKKVNENVRLIADSHTDYNNSARGIISKYILHGLFYRKIAQEIYPFLDKLFYISLECKDFLIQAYGLSEKKMEFLPLGGLIVDWDEKEKCRREITRDLNICNDDIILICSGKMNKSKRILELLKAFSNINSTRMHLLIIGSIGPEISNDFIKLTKNDTRIKYLGWKTSNQLIEYICASDFYLQPGSQSATLQNAICCGCPIMVYPFKSHAPFLDGNGYYVETIADIEGCLRMIEDNSDIVRKMSENSYRIAREKLDYKILARKVLI